MLKATTPEIKDNPRFKCIIFGPPGAGKSKFAYSFKNAYIHGTENTTEYRHFAEQIKGNNSVYIEVDTLDDVIDEVHDLLSTKHKYTTYIFDSPSPLYHTMLGLEAERLAKKDGSEGDEYQRNAKKANRKLARLSLLLSRLDMNVIIITHEKNKFENGRDAGMTYDLPVRLGHAVGTILHLNMLGSQRKAKVVKTRYDAEMPINDFIDFTIDGHEEICKRLGIEIFQKLSTPDPLATSAQVEELLALLQYHNVPEEKVQDWLLKGKAASLEELAAKHAQSLIEYLKSKPQPTEGK